MHFAWLKVLLILRVLRNLREEKLLKQTTSPGFVSLPEGAHGRAQADHGDRQLLTLVPLNFSCVLTNSPPPSPPARAVQKYLYFIPVSARTVSCSDSPWRCRNFSSCFSWAAGLGCPGQPAAGGPALGTTLCFLPFRSASLGFWRLGLWGGMSAQLGLYKCMVHTLRRPSMPSRYRSVGSSRASTLQSAERRAQCHHAPTSTRRYELGYVAQEDHRTMERYFSPSHSLYYCNWLILIDAQDGFWPRSAILFSC